MPVLGGTAEAVPFPNTFLPSTASAATAGVVSLCFLVDGSVINGGSCPDLGVVSTSSWNSVSFSLVTTAAKGTHSIQTEIWPSVTASRGYYTVTYRVYKP